MNCNPATKKLPKHNSIDANILIADLVILKMK